MAESYRPLYLPLTGGLDQSSPSLIGKASDGFNSAVNVDFGVKGQVRGRPGFKRNDGFGTRKLATTGLSAADAGTTTWANLAAKDKNTAGLVRIRDARGERPGVFSQGHLWTWDLTRWTDRLGCASARVDRVAEYLGGLTSYSNGSYTPPVAAGSVLGPSATNTSQYQVLGQDGTVEYVGNGNSQNPGNAARLASGVEMIVTSNGANLFATIGQAGTQALTQATLAADAAAVTGLGDAPCVCGDYDSTVFYVAYLTTTAHQVKILKVDTTGTVLTSTTFTFGTGTLHGVWVANSSVATGKLIVACTDTVSSGVFTTVRSMATLATSGIDATVDVAFATKNQVVVGAADQASAWVAFKVGSTQPGTIRILTRSMTAATSELVMGLSGQDYPIVTSPSTQGRGLFLAHQPVDLGGRVYMTLHVVNYWDNNTNISASAATWVTLDLTDLWHSGTTTGTKIRPTFVAQGPRDGSMATQAPASAAVFSSTSFRFPGVNWNLTIVGLPVAGVEGTGTLGVNQVTLQVPTTDHVGESTVLSGSVPHEVARGACHEVAFPFSRPTVSVAMGAGGSFPTGSCTVQAVWRWTDEAGQVHQSEPSSPVTFTVVGGTQTVTFSADGPLTEREYDTLYVDFYCTSSGGTAHLLNRNTAGQTGKVTQRDGGSIALNPVTLTVVSNFAAGQPLYTDGSGLANQPPRADGGVATVGNRMWTSDGRQLFASQLPVLGNAPAWNLAGPLILQVPATAGRIVSLAGVDDKLIALCERGVYAVNGQGPDNTGSGPGFSDPVKVADLGTFGARTSVAIPGVGLLFYANNGSHFDDGGYGGGAYTGLWALDRSLTVQRVSWPAQTALENGVSDLVYLPEREQAYLLATDGTIVVWDIRSKLWATWTCSSGGPATALTVAAGVLWTNLTGVQATGEPAAPGSFSLVPGSDTLGSPAAYTMAVTTNHLFANGTDGLGWARLRSIRVLGELATTSLVYSVLLDQRIPYTHAFTEAPPGVTTTWPTDREAPEWRLPQQKCSSAQVTISATPATAGWVALELQIMPLGRAPAYERA